MIQVDEKETIRRLYFIQRHSLREIAKELHHSRKTVKKAITDASVPEYHLTVPRTSPVMDPFRGIIERKCCFSDTRKSVYQLIVHQEEK